MMAFTSIANFLRRNDVMKLLNQTAKQIKGKDFVNYAKVINITYSTQVQKCTVTRLNTIILPNRYYSIKTAENNDIEYCNEHNITIIGNDVPGPFKDLDTCGFPDYIKNFLRDEGFTKPTVIQSQGWPIALAGKNFVGIAQTGTGKTLAYLLPAVVHIKETKAKRGKGPRVLVLAPTRELARQIEEVAKDFERSMSVRCLCVYGGVSRTRQAAELQQGVDILIATPGRLNDFINSKITSLSRCTYVVLDEADRMLDMGFEPQIREALEEVPLERQILMFSATWPKEVQHLAKDYLGEFVQVNVGSTELSANHNIDQKIHICEEDQKMDKFKSIMHQISGDGMGKVLVFTNTKRFVDTLTMTLRRNGWPAVGIHGDRTQLQRDSIINKFKSGQTNILVATDVAARGLDVEGVTHVVNYDFPNTSEDYIHRIGRTGRLKNKGVSHTILTTEDARQAKSLMSVLKEAHQEIPKDLEMMAKSYDISKDMKASQKYKPKKYGWNQSSNYSQRKWSNRFGNHRDRNHGGRYNEDRY